MGRRFHGKEEEGSVARGILVHVVSIFSAQKSCPTHPFHAGQKTRLILLLLGVPERNSTLAGVLVHSGCCKETLGMGNITNNRSVIWNTELRLQAGPDPL